MDKTTEPRAARKTPRWVKIAFGLSLALNLVIIGAAGGAAWRISKFGQTPQMRNGYAFVFALEREDRKAVLAELRKAGRSIHKQGRSDMQEVLALLRAPTLELPALRAAIESQVNRGAAFQSQVASAWLDRVQTMDQDARLAYADRLEEKMKRRGKRRAPSKD